MSFLGNIQNIFRGQKKNENCRIHHKMRTNLKNKHFYLHLLLSPGVQFSQESLDPSETGIPGNTVLGGGAYQLFNVHKIIIMFDVCNKVGSLYGVCVKTQEKLKSLFQFTSRFYVVFLFMSFDSLPALERFCEYEI